jgi:hypothetical protein
MKYLNTYKLYEKIGTPDIISDLVQNNLDYIKSSIINSNNFTLNINDSKIVNKKICLYKV